MYTKSYGIIFRIRETRRNRECQRCGNGWKCKMRRHYADFILDIDEK